MRILLSNDDGYRAPGLVCLADALARIGEVHVVAPERDRSGASNSLTLDYPLRPRQAENGFIYVDGTPTDCVHLAITGLLEDEPDIVVSGINSGPNLGDDVIYSGTVAAAMEGRFLGLPAIAVSLVSAGANHYDTAARVVMALLGGLISGSMGGDTILNVNVPDVAYDELQGLEVTRLGHRHKAEPVVRSVDPRGESIYWVGPPGGEQDAGPGTDFHAVRRGAVSITPMQVDLTRHGALAGIAEWVRSVKLT
ncbi:MAG: 5'/3'-nucleotidase SurE [Gammaproteobacteria bacterium]|nr:5'/3'-nucleotidase SurE [Gammaproteobacteria bacterium]